MPTDKAPEYLTGAFAGEGTIETFKAGSAVTKGYVVKLTGDLQVEHSANNEKSIGVALKAAASGEYVPVLVRGKVKLTAAGAISVGAAVKAAGSGKVQAAVTTVTIPTGATTVTSTSAQPSMTVESGIAFGVALQSASADGDTILCIIDCIR